MCKCGADLCVWLGKRLSQIPAFSIAWEGLVVCFLSPFCTFLFYLLTSSVRQTTLGKVLRALGFISWDFGYSNDIVSGHAKREYSAVSNVNLIPLSNISLFA